ncbi:MAG TPA: PPC domain-containing protein [Methylomirabilota bacterium]|nr:PPC domain-containing protein [Methylomirabilota bacterium]
MGAAVPALEHFLPVTVQAGATNTVAAIGKFDPWPPRVWVEGGGVEFLPQTNKAVFSVLAEPGTPAGPRLVRCFNAEGSSQPRVIIVSTDPVAMEAEPNDDRARPQPVGRTPAIIDGRLDKTGDVDSFAVSLAAGQTLVAALEAYVLASPLDAALRVVDARGVQVAWNHDDGRTLDPMLAWTAPAAGQYVVQVMGFPYPATSEVRLHGGDACVYRLHLSADACVSHTLPLGVEWGVTNRLQLCGWNLAGTEREVIFDGRTLSPNAAFTSLPGAAHRPGLELPIGRGRELLESEPNDDAARAQPVPTGSAVTGCISQAGDEDRYRVTLSGKETLQARIQAAFFGFPLDAWLKIEDEAGHPLARNDDADGADPRLEWSAPSNGTFVVAIGNLLHRGDSNCLYRLVLDRPRPDFRLTTSEHGFVLRPGTTNEIKITVTRMNGFDGRVTLRAEGLPPGVAAPDIEVPEKGSEALLKLVAATNAVPHSGVFQVTGLAGPERRAVIHEFIATTENNGVPGGFRRLIVPSTDRLWLTVAPPAQTNAGSVARATP